MWYKESQKIMGYKIVAYNKGRAFSLYNNKITYNLSIGSISSDIFLGTNEKFCLDYYSGLTDDQELILTYSYNPSDIISGGDSGSGGGEVRVKKAILEGYKEINKDSF